jgi:hypothetical protein
VDVAAGAERALRGARRCGGRSRDPAEQLDAEITVTRGGGTGFELTFAAAAS